MRPSNSRQPFRSVMAFTHALPLSRSHRHDSLMSQSRICRNDPMHRSPTISTQTPTCSVTHETNKVTRRAALSLLAVTSLLPLIRGAQAERVKVDSYDANKSRRYVEEGRPPPDRSAPMFDSSKALFDIDEDLKAQDLKTGSGQVVEKGTLVMARWLAVLDDGTTVDDSNEKQPAMIRPGAHQIPPGIEDSMIGMQMGGVRRISGSSGRILSNITLGNNIGERSLVPSDGTMYVDIFVDRVNPFGTSR